MTRSCPAILLAIIPLSAAPHVRVGIASDNGRHGVTVEGLAADTPGLHDAVARLLGCPVELSFGGFRCSERKLVDGLKFSGQLDFAPFLTLPGMSGATATVLLPASPLAAVSGLVRKPPAWWTARAEFSGVPPVDAPIAYQLGFSWMILLADLAPLPLLLCWLIQRPEPRWGFAAAMSVWVLWLASSGTLALNLFFWSVPSVEGAFLRWISWLPLGLMIVVQARWMGMPLLSGVWIPMAVLILLRPRSAQWMTFGEATLSDVVSVALLALVAGPMLMRGRNGALLPEPLSAALQRRGPLVSRFDVRLDRPALDGQISPPRLGRLVTIPAGWLERVSGRTLESAVLISCLRVHYAPVARALGFLVAVWIVLSLPAQRLPWLIGVAPLMACAGYTWFERRWDGRVAEEAVKLGEEPPVIRDALVSIRPEWGEATVRIAARLPQ